MAMNSKLCLLVPVKVIEGNSLVDVVGSSSFSQWVSWGPTASSFRSTTSLTRECFLTGVRPPLALKEEKGKTRYDNVERKKEQRRQMSLTVDREWIF